MVIGTLKGPMFVETDEGPADAGSRGLRRLDPLRHGHRPPHHSGACSFSAQDGATAWGEWKCTGYELIGCRGTLRPHRRHRAGWRAPAGQGSMVWRPSAHDFKKQLDGTVLQNIPTGVLIWRDFKLVARAKP